MNKRLFIDSLDRVCAGIPGIRSLTGSSVLITGSTGLIGSALAFLLVRASEGFCPGLKVYAAGRNRERLLDLYHEEISKGLVEPIIYHAETGIEGDIVVDYVVHAASNAHPAAFGADPVGTVEANVNGITRLLEYARTVGVRRTVYVSSGEVYGEMGAPVSELAEEDAGRGYISLSSPRSAYPEAKRTAEVVCVSAAAQYQQEVVIVRPSHTYGPNQTASDSRAHAQFLKSASCGEDIVMKSAGAQVRSYTYVADTVSGIVTCMLEGRPGEAYNIANSNAKCSIAEFATMCAESGRTKVIHDHTDIALPGSPISRQVLSSKKLESLGWRGCYDCAEGICLSIRCLQLKD